jgi:hypothetical protein
LFFLQPSQKRLLSSLNPAFVVLFVFGLLLLRTAWEPMLPGFYRRWDVLLPFMIYFGQRRSLPEGLILALFTSHLFSLCSTAPIGVFASHYLILFLIARLLSYVIYANSWFSTLLLLLSLSVLSRFILTLVAATFGHGWPLFAKGNFIWWGPLLNSVAGLLVYRLIETLDRMTYKVPRTNIELSENGI